MSKEYKAGVKDTLMCIIGGVAWVVVIMKALAIMLNA